MAQYNLSHYASLFCRTAFYKQERVFYIRNLGTNLRSATWCQNLKIKKEGRPSIWAVPLVDLGRGSNRRSPLLFDLEILALRGTTRASPEVDQKKEAPVSR